MPTSITFTTAQTSGQSCGAFALAAAAVALKGTVASTALTHTPGGDAHFTQRTSTVAYAGTTDQTTFAEGIYAITGDLNSVRLTDQSKPEYLNGSGENSPSALVYVAKALGLSVSVNLTGAKGTSSLEKAYPTETGRVTVEGATVNYSATKATPATDTIHLVCVLGSAGLHWLAQDSSGSYFDPATGGALKTSTTGYSFTGLWLILGK